MNLLCSIDPRCDNTAGSLGNYGEAVNKNKTEITVTNRTLFKVLGIGLVAFLLIRITIALAHPITLILIAFFLAMALNPAVSWISRKLGKKTRRSTATALAFVSVLVVLITYFSLVLPPLVSQVGNFISDIPSTIQNLKTQDSPVGRTVRRYNLDGQIDKLSHDFSSRVSAKPVLDTAGRIGGTLVSILAVLAMTFMMLNEGPAWVERILVVQPEAKRNHYKKLLQKMYGMVTGYVNGQFIMASIAGLFCLVVLVIASSVIGVSVNAVALAGMLAIFGLIPMIGNPLGAFVVILGCLLSSFNLAIVMAIYFLIYAQIENVTLQPYIQSKQNELTPLTVFVSALLGVSYAGIIGALFAIPVAGSVRILIIDWMERKGLRKPAD
jgi:predicted PurR-regulated permease PerM